MEYMTAVRFTHSYARAFHMAFPQEERARYYDGRLRKKAPELLTVLAALAHWFESLSQVHHTGVPQNLVCGLYL
jgi:hypothetical protein